MILSSPESETPQIKYGLLVGTLAAAGITVSLAQTLVIPIIGRLPEIFNTTAADASWIVTVTLLAGAVATPVMGRLADMYGKKKMMLISLIPFILGSVLCAVSVDLIPMIIGRGLQGLGSGLIPLGISLMHDLLPKEKAGSAIALMSSSMGIGGALGLPLAAAIAQFSSWRVLFWFTAVVALLVTVVIWKAIPASAKIVRSGGFDYFGALGLATGLIALLLAVSKGSEWGWGSALTIGLIVAAVAILVGWGWFETRQKSPLIDLRTTSRPTVLMTNIASILIGFTMYGLNLILPQVMQLPVDLGYGLGQSMLQMGIWLIPMGLGMMLISNAGAAISAARGPRVTLTIAGVVIAVGYALTVGVLLTIGNRTPGVDADSALILATLVLYSVCSLVVGIGIGLAYGSMPALIMGAVPATEKAAANGFNALMRSLGTTSSSAIIGAVLAGMMRDGVPTLGGFMTTLIIGCCAAVVAAVVSYFIPTTTTVVEAK